MEQQLFEHYHSTSQNVSKLLTHVQARAGDFIYYSMGCMIEVDITLVSAATSDAIVQPQFPGILTGVQLYDANDEEWFDNVLEAAVLAELNRFVRRAGPDEIAAISADSNTTHSPPTMTLRIWIPHYLPSLEDPRFHIQPAELVYKKFVATLGATTLWGTGQVVTAASTAIRLFVDLVPMRGLWSRARLAAFAHTQSKFLDEVVNTRGRPLYVGLVDHNAGATTTFAATDLTQYEIKGGRFGVYGNRGRQNIDAPAMLYNSMWGGSGDAGEGQYPVATGGAARSIPLLTHKPGAQISEIPYAENLTVSQVVGAGAPALTDHKICGLVSRPRDDIAFARGLAGSRTFPGTYDELIAGLGGNARGKGRSGQVQLQGHEMGNYLPRAWSREAARKAGYTPSI